jgi:hypothetical protein
MVEPMVLDRDEHIRVLMMRRLLIILGLLLAPFVGHESYSVGNVAHAGSMTLLHVGSNRVSPPVSTTAPVISGTATIGSTISSTTGVWTNSPTSYTYQWQRNGSNIGGATASTYLTVTADGGTSLTCIVTAVNAGGSVSATSNALSIAPAVLPPVNTTAPVISGTPTGGSTISSTTGVWTNSPTSYTYQWQRNGSNISGATASTYLTVSADGGTSLTDVVTAINASGSASATSNALSIAPNLITPVMSSVSLPSTGTASQYGGTTATTQNAANSISNNPSNRRVVLPFAGTIGNLHVHLANPNPGLTVTNHLGSLGLGIVTCNFATAPNNDCTSGVTQTVNSGTLFQYELDTTATWPGLSSQFSFTYTASNGQHAAIMGQAGAGGVSAGPVFYPIYGGTLNGTDSNVAALFCSVCGGQIHGWYAIPNGTEGASGAHFFALAINGVPSAVMTCTDAVSSSTGCCVNDQATPGTIDNNAACTTVSPITINPGDSISVQVGCASGTCGSIFPGFGIDFTPTTLNVVPVLSTSAGLSNPSWAGLYDVNMTTTSQFNYQMAPVNMTYSHLGMCGLAQFLTTATLKAVAQSGTTGNPPTTPGVGPSATISVSSGACTGANSSVYLSGVFDNVNTLPLTAGQTTDINVTRVGAVNSTIMKVFGAITVP